VAIDQDVLVVGDGLAGRIGAISAARAGARTRLVAESASTLGHASGLIDLLGYTPDGEGPLVDPLDALSRLPDAHPYRRAGRAAVEAGFALFDDIAGGAYRGGHTRKNALVPTGGGRVKPTARYPLSVAPGLAGDGRDTLLVGFAELPTVDAELAAANLDGTFAGTVRGATVQFPADLDADAAVTRFAHLLDRDERATDSASLRHALAERIDRHLSGERRVGLPAVLGRNHTDDIRATLEELLSVDIFELPMGPPSVPGLRLDDLLSAAVDSAGVLVETGNPVVDFESDDGTIQRVTVDRSGAQVPYTASEFVLATGGLVGTGIETERERVREPVFDCHVAHPPDRYDWFERDAFGAHPFARFGVEPDGEMRPLDADGRPAFENLRAAGAVLGNYDFAAEKSGSGVSLATGHRAGRLAGERARATTN
jgi:glycerol-3-phosphate dehydrogenase subunit B